MKTNEWSYRKHDVVTWTIACIMWTLVLLGIMLSSCATPRSSSDSMAYRQDTVRWEQFLECSKDQGDLGCDSCFYLIYGYYLDDAYETYR